MDFTKDTQGGLEIFYFKDNTVVYTHHYIEPKSDHDHDPDMFKIDFNVNNLSTVILLAWKISNFCDEIYWRVTLDDIAKIHLSIDFLTYPRTSLHG